MSFTSDLAAAFGGGRVRELAPLAPLTTFKVGGAAEWLIETRGPDEIVRALRLAHAADVPVTILGGGSNVLIADGGIRGLVIRPRAGAIEAPSDDRVRADAGVTINALVRWTINRGLSGLEAWAGTPGTVGGGIFGNAHYAGRLLGDLVESVTLADRKGELRDVARAHMDFGYDRSRLQRTQEVLLWAVFRVGHGDPAALRAVARASLSFRKRTQPLERSSAGCIFQNPDPASVQLPPSGPSSAGALVEGAGLKGHALGDARVSPTHANFIVNEGHATATDIRSLIELCRERVRERFGIELQEEIVYLGDFGRQAR